MKNLACIVLLSAVAAPAMAAPPQAAPMTEPPPRMVVQSAAAVAYDRTARSPATGQSTHAIMMPGQDMPRPIPTRGAQAARPKSSSEPRS